MKVVGKSTRFHERTKLEIPVEVNYCENDDNSWKETAFTEEVTICGGGFTLLHPVEPKRLVQLKMPLPNRFRLFDHGKKQYEIWGLIRYLQIADLDAAGQIRFKVGAAFIGEDPPPSFQHNPTTLYDLNPVLRNQSFWNLRELPRRTGPFMRSAEERHPVQHQIILETVSSHGQIIESVAAESENISESGMALTTKLSIGCPEFVLIKDFHKNSSLLAKVRGVHMLDTSQNLRLHLEFISGKWFV